MEDQQSDDWLPEGWTVEIRERRNGKQDKCYCVPSGDRIFFSKAEVFRYLSINGIKCDEKEKEHSKQFGNNVTIERVEVQGLPPGWTKEIKITKKSNKIRKDPHYIDPVNGFVFRSMRDALRYIETGDVGRLAFKPKDKCINDEDWGDDNNCTLVSKTDEEVLNGRADKMDISNVTQTVTGDQLATAVEGERINSFGLDSDQCKVDGKSSAMGSGDDLDEKKLEQIGVNSGGSTISSAFPIEALQIKQPPEGPTMVDKKKMPPSQNKSKVRKMPELPRRASKRLAGLAVELTPDLKESSRGRRTTVKKSCDAVTSAAEPSSPGSCNLQAPKLPDETKSTVESVCTFRCEKTSGLKNNKTSSSDRLSLSCQSQKAEMETKVDDLKVSSANGTASEVLSGEARNDDKAVEMQALALPFDVPLPDLWEDPCIAFAIKTLTGITCETPKVSSESNSCSKSLEAVSMTDEHSGGVQGGSGSSERQGHMVLPFTHLIFSEENIPKVEGGNLTDSKPETANNTPLPDILADPCFEFAIKTLTGAIPVGFGHEHLEPSEQQANNMQAPTGTGSHSTMPDNTLGPKNLWPQQCDVSSGKTMYKELVFSCSGNPGFRNQGGNNGRHQCSEERMDAKGRPSALMYSSGNFVDMNGRF